MRLIDKKPIAFEYVLFGFCIGHIVISMMLFCTHTVRSSFHDTIVTESEMPVVTTESVSITETTTATTTSETTAESTTDTPVTTRQTTSYTTTTISTSTTKAAADAPTSGLMYIGTFKGTYYAGKTVPCKGGSGRTLIDCTIGKDGLKGSVASKYIYQKYGYKVNGRTKVYLELTNYPKMSGWYYVDDCNADSRIVDFYFHYNKNCPWRVAGITEVKMYV